MWTAENRGRYDRSKLRYPSDLTNEEWGLVEPLIPPGKGNMRRVNVREVMNGVMYILSTGCQWPPLGRRTNHCLAKPLSKVGQGLGEPQPQGARFLAPGINPHHAPKAL